MAQWANFPFKDPLYTNADESILRAAPAAVENVYANRAGGFSAIPGMRPFAALPGQGRVYVTRFRDDLVACTQAGRTFRFAADGMPKDVSGVLLAGGGRPVFAATDDYRLIVASGGPLVQLRSDRTELLSAAAPESTHVAYIDGYLIAPEAGSGRFRYSNPGEYDKWEDLSVFSAEGKPDDINAVVVTPYRELLVTGPESIEQFERLQSGTKPFFRRWTTGEGLAHPHTLVADVTGTYGVNLRSEFVRFQAQIAREQSDDVALSLEEIDDWTDAWAAPLSVAGQRFVLLQAPRGYYEPYGVRGVTLLLDYRRKRWSFLWGWDSDAGGPRRWPGWSVAQVAGRTFIGMEDGVAEMSPDVMTNNGEIIRRLWRSAHVDEFGPSRIDNVRIRMKRGVDAYDGPEALVGMRMRRDQHRWTKWQWRPLGRPGHEDAILEFGPQGAADLWQMEIAVTAPVDVQFVNARIQVERLGW